MPSSASQNWSGARAAALDVIEDAHRLVRRGGPGQQEITQQINQAYALLLSSQFQGFCRDLHSECGRLLLVPGSSPAIQAVHFTNIVHGRRLDSGNPTPGNIGADFNRLGLTFWPPVDADHPRNPQRKALLEDLNRWRNAIAHNDFTPAMLRGGRPRLPLADVQEWRRACDGLARSFDKVLRAHLLQLNGRAPW